jgi:transcriptional regulator with XRE-family HTH domain
MTTGIISNKLKLLKFKKIDLIEYLPLSRATLYVYMDYYEKNMKDQIPNSEFIKLFDYILRDDVTKNDIIKYMLDNFQSDDSIDSKTFSSKDYVVDENVLLLQKNLKVLRKAAGWEYDYLSENTGIQEERLKKIEEGQAKLTKTEAIAIFTSLCRESRERDEDDILPITFFVIFDEHHLLLEEREIGLIYISAVADSKEKIGKEEFKNTFEKMTGKEIGPLQGTTVAGVVAAAVTAIVVGGLVFRFIKK